MSTKKILVVDDSPTMRRMIVASLRDLKEVDLVVDDESDAREMLKLMLVHRGVEVRTAATATEALRVLEEWRPNVLVSDIGMPDEDGYSLIGRLRSRELERGGQTPAVALTGYTGPEDRRRLLAAGYQICLAKPLNLVELTVVLAKLVERPISC